MHERDGSKIYFFNGLANIAPDGSQVVVEVCTEEQPGYPAYVQLEYNNLLYIFQLPLNNTADFKVNKVFVQKMTNLPYAQLVIDYCAGTCSGQQGWKKDSYLCVISWLKNRFEIVFFHSLLQENHYTYDRSVNMFSYLFDIRHSQKKIVLTRQDMVKEEFLWKDNKYVPYTEDTQMKTGKRSRLYA